MDLDIQLELWRKGNRQSVDRTASAETGIPSRSDELVDLKAVGTSATMEDRSYSGGRPTSATLTENAQDAEPHNKQRR